MLWVKAFHLIFMVTWFAGLFYLPRLFVYHADAHDEISNERFKIMERRLMVMSHIGAVLTIAFGLALLIMWRPDLLKAGWFHAKLTLLIALIGYHHACMRMVKKFAADANTRSAKFYRIFNEVPAFALIGIMLLAILKPF